MKINDYILILGLLILLGLVIFWWFKRKASNNLSLNVFGAKHPTPNPDTLSGHSTEQRTTDTQQPTTHTQDLLKKVRRIEIKTKNLSNDLFAGSYHSAFKGKGMSFSEVRAYGYGDDVRNIDWNVTARGGAPFVKVFEEERELTVIILIDVSKSSAFGTSEQLKSEVITEISAVLSFSAIQNNDKVGVTFFSDVIEKFIPPKKGKSHILRIIRELIDFKASSPRTDIEMALKYLNNVMKKRSVVFILSDFIDQKSYSDALRLAKKKHDIIGVQLFDNREAKLPDIGLVQTIDAESGEMTWLDTSSKSNRDKYAQWFAQHCERTKDVFAKSGTELIRVETMENYTKALLKAFKKRK